MLKKYYSYHIVLMLLGISSITVSYFTDIVLIGIKLEHILKISAFISFAVSLWYYYKIISTISKVTDITGAHVHIAMLCHGATLLSLFIIGRSPAFYVLFIGSIAVRSLMGITEIDRQMKSLCKEIDTAFLIEGIKERENEA